MPNARGFQNVSSNVPDSLAEEVDKLAAASDLTRSKYVRALLEDAVSRARVFRLRPQVFVEEVPNAQLNDKPPVSYRSKPKK